MGIFQSAEVFTSYRATLQFRSQVFGSTPSDPKIIEGWLRSKAGIGSDEEVKRALLRTLEEVGVEVSDEMTYEELDAAAKKVGSQRGLNVFKRARYSPDHPPVLGIEGRIIKAAIKEDTNILFAGQRWGKTLKGPKAFVAERVFVHERFIPFQRPDGTFYTDPTSIEQIVGHVQTPKGPRSVLVYHEAVDQPRITFHVLVTKDAVTPAQWAEIWVQAEENGLGGARPMGHGTFDILEWEQVPLPIGTPVTLEAVAREVTEARHLPPDQAAVEAEAIVAAITTDPRRTLVPAGA